jgi:hypothetical protein
LALIPPFLACLGNRFSEARGANATLRKEERYYFDEKYEVLRLYNTAAVDEALSLVLYQGLAVACLPAPPRSRPGLP